MSDRFDILPAQDQAPLADEPYDRWLTADGDEALQFRRRPQGYHLRFPDVADFAVTLAKDGSAIACTPVPETPEDILVDLHFNQVLPLLMTHDGALVLHASAVRIGDVAVAFLGKSGRGKSTLAAAFAKAGHPFLTDDGLVLKRDRQGYRVTPRRPLLRLREDSEEALTGAVTASRADHDLAKGRVMAGDVLPHEGKALPLAAIFVLVEPGEVAETAIAPMAAATVLSALLDHSFMLDVDDRARVRAHFGRLADLAADCPCFSLDYPRDYAALPQVIAAIRKFAECLPG